MSAFRHMVVANLKMTIRNRSALFWLLTFPVIFIVLLGSLITDGDFEVHVGVVGAETSPITNEVVEQMRQAGGFAVTTGEEARERPALAEGERDVVVIFGQNGSGSAHTARIYFNQADPQASQVAVAAVRQFLSEANRALSGSQPVIAVAVEGVTGANLRYIDFLVPGVLAMSIMTNGMVGLSSSFVTYRERGILRRIRATPFPLLSFILARITTQVLIAVIQAVVLLGVGFVLFDIQIIGDYLSLLAMVTLGALAFLALGFFISGVAPNTETSDSLSNAIAFPMMFLGGVFFPIDSAPAWMQPVTRVIPLTYLANALRDITIRGDTLFDVWPDVLAMTLTAVLGLALAARFFRWEARSG